MKGVRERRRFVCVCVHGVCLLDLPPYLILTEFPNNYFCLSLTLGVCAPWMLYVRAFPPVLWFPPVFFLYLVTMDPYGCEGASLITKVLYGG